jgi:putative transposase
VSNLSHEQRVALVERESSELPLTHQAELLNVSRSSLYSQAQGPSAEEIAVNHRIDELYTHHPFYGSRKIGAHLRREGVLKWTLLSRQEEGQL